MGEEMKTEAAVRGLQRDGLAWKLSRPLLLLSAAFAAFQGARMPSLWAVTLYTPSVTGGFVKRSLVGTLLRPLFVIDKSYWLAAGIAVAVLVAILVIIVSAAWRSELLSQRYLVVGFLLIPAGGFVFNEIGYLEQFVYLAFFAAVACLTTKRVGLAAALIAVTPLIHELSILTVLPVFLFLALQRLELKRAAIAVAPAAVVAAVTLVLPTVGHATIDRLAAQLTRAGYRFRPDALDLFGRSRSAASAHFASYSVQTVLNHTVPYGAIACGAIVAVMVCTPRLHRDDLRRRWPVYLAAVAAVGAPTLLSFGGYDYNRWSFMTLANLALVAWFWIGAARRELSIIPALGLVLVALFTWGVGINYFDGFIQRPLSPSGVQRLVDDFRHPASYADWPACDPDPVFHGEDAHVESTRSKCHW
jgi:hypothetical protein